MQIKEQSMLTVQYETVVAAVALLLVGTAVQLGISDLVAGAVMQPHASPLHSSALRRKKLSKSGGCRQLLSPNVFNCLLAWES